MSAVPLPAGAARAASLADDEDRQRYIFTIPSRAIRGVAADHQTRSSTRPRHCGVGAHTTALLVRAVLAAGREPRRCMTRPPPSASADPLRMLKVELPLFIPVLVAGLRVVAVTNIAMVSVGSVIGTGAYLVHRGVSDRQE